MNPVDLIRENYFFRRWPTFKQLIKFGIVGLGNTIIDFSVYFGLTRVSDFWRGHYLVANFLAFWTAVTFSFFVNKHWTFRAKQGSPRKQYLQFFSIAFCGLLWSELILFAAVDVFDFHDLVGKITAVSVIFFWNFFLNKILTFRNLK